MFLRIRDENGNWVSIDVIKGERGEKGEPGESYTLTAADKEEIAGMVEVPEVNLKDYYTKSEVDNLISAIPTYSDGDEVSY